MTLGAYREAMLRGQQWLGTGDPTAHEQHLAATQRYRTLVADHRERWTGDLDHPPYSFAAADTGLTLALLDERVGFHLGPPEPAPEEGRRTGRPLARQVADLMADRGWTVLEGGGS